MKRKSIIVLSAIIFSMAFLSTNSRNTSQSVNQVGGIAVCVGGCYVEGGWGEALLWVGGTSATLGGGGLAACAIGMASNPLGWGIAL